MKIGEIKRAFSLTRIRWKEFKRDLKFENYVFIERENYFERTTGSPPPPMNHTYPCAYTNARSFSSFLIKTHTYIFSM